MIDQLSTLSQQPTPTFLNPPIVEFVLGAQFSPLANLSSAHFGLFWKQLGEDWIKPRDNPLIQDQFERFDLNTPPRRWQVRVEPAPLVNRLTLMNRNSDRLLQIQPTRFHVNWRKTADLKPSYKELITEFEELFGRFECFCTQESLGALEINQWEVTYIDFFAKGEYWHSPEDWNNFLPGLFRELPPAIVKPLRMERREVQWTMEIQPKLGRLHVAASQGQWNDNGDEGLILSMTARGPLVPEHTPTLRGGLDLGHVIAVNQFLEMINDDTKRNWGERK